MVRYVKCQFCNESEPYSKKEEMEVIKKVSDKGTTKNLYYHSGDCWDKFHKKNEFIKKELEERDKLNDVIKSIYNVEFHLPTRLWTLIQDLRNGTNRYRKFFKKKYKEGVPYDVLAEAYLMSRSSIKWAKLNKRFKSLQDEICYGLIIVQSKIEDANKKMKNSNQSKLISESKESSVVRDMLEERTIDYKKHKTEEEDLSNIFGDDD